ncbi:MAG: alpha-L-fucosidase [Acidimicrobiales bacterium]
MAIDVRLSLAMVPSFAPAGWDAGHYERHLRPNHDPLPEVLAWHAEHWPNVASFADFAHHLDLSAWNPELWAQLIRDAGAVGLPADASLAPPPPGDRFPFVKMRAELDRACAKAEPLSAEEVDAPRRQSFTRGIGPSTTWNQAETDDDRLDGAAIVALLAEVASLGLDLTLAIGPAPDGSIPPPISEPLRAAGRWIQANAGAVGDVEPFDVPGDNEVRYTARRGPSEGLREVFIIDLTGAPTREIAHFSPHRYPIVEVDGARSWEQGLAGLRLAAPIRSEHADSHDLGDIGANVYRLIVRDKRARSLSVRGERAGGQVRIANRAFPTITAALAVAQQGGLVDVPAGHYGAPTEHFPLVIPAGVTLVGHESDDPNADPPTIDGAGEPLASPLVELRSGAAIAGMTVLAPRAVHELPGQGPRGQAGTIVSRDATGTKVERCTVHGSITHDQGRNHAVRFCHLIGGHIATGGADEATITGNHVVGSIGPGATRRVTSAAAVPDGAPTGVGISIVAGDDHRIDANTVEDFAGAIQLHATSGAAVSANAAFAGQQGIELRLAQDSVVTGNQCRGGRAIAVIGGRSNNLTANIADRTDTGLLLDGDAAATTASGNQFVDCRIGILAWSHTGSALDGNQFTDCWEHDVVDLGD